MLLKIQKRVIKTLTEVMHNCMVIKYSNIMKWMFFKQYLIYHNCQKKRKKTETVQ